jgi:hypothetical protein
MGNANLIDPLFEIVYSVAGETSPRKASTSTGKYRRRTFVPSLIPKCFVRVKNTRISVCGNSLNNNKITLSS